MSTQTITVVLTDTITGQETTATVDFDISEITVQNPGDQAGTVGIPV